MKRRMNFALLIDCIVIGCIAAIGILLCGISDFNIVKTDSDGIIVSPLNAVIFFVYSFVVLAISAFLFALKDLAFKNASIGMKIMGLMILDKDFNIPSTKKMFKRSLRMFLQRDIEYAIHRNKQHFILKWEYNSFGTITVDRKRFLNNKENYIREILDELKSDIRY